ncbi:hypothetical protein, partial [Streptomyces sp. URMC 123]|uniref:hypothetical protein n=1 Tax=Streptomyces sp. URMC 123 TaxID=3423403 RepID=UPI003F1C456C
YGLGRAAGTTGTAGAARLTRLPRLARLTGVSGLTVRNPGTKPMTVQAVRLTGDSAAFTVANDECSGRRLAPGQQSSCRVTVAFAPRTIGAHSAELSVTWGGRSSFVTLSGRAYATVTVTVVNPFARDAMVRSDQHDPCERGTCVYKVYRPGLTLTAQTQALRFTGWSGACEGAAAVCAPRLTGAETVTATFAKPNLG